MAHARPVVTDRGATTGDLRLASRAIRGTPSAADTIIIEDATNIAAAARAGVGVEAVYVPADHETRVDIAAPHLSVPPASYRALFFETRVPRVFATARLPRPASRKAVAAAAGDLVVLDGAAGPGNIGSVIRLAAAYEAAAVVVLGGRRRELYRRGVVRASAGAIFGLPVLAMTAADLITFSVRNGLMVVATSPRGGVDVRAIAQSSRRLAIVFGSETSGVSDEIANAAGHTLHIPTPGNVESLNLSSATAIVLFERHVMNANERRATKG